MAHDLTPVGIDIDPRFDPAPLLARILLSGGSPPWRAALERQVRNMLQFVSAQPNA